MGRTSTKNLNLPIASTTLLTGQHGMLCRIALMENGLRGVFLFTICTGYELNDGLLGAADPATHKIYIWDISNDGQFASTLDGGREPLVHLHVGAIFPFETKLD